MAPISMDQKIKVMELACRKAEFQEGFEDIYSRMIGQLTGNSVEDRPVVECIEGPIPSAKHECCERWLQFLDETIGDAVAIAQLQDFFGYCLLPTMRYPKALLLSGLGFGKSTLVNILRHLVGQGQASVGIDLSSFESAFGRSCLVDSRMVFFDVKSIETLNNFEDFLKQVLYGEEFQVCTKHVGSYNARAQSRLVFVSRNISRQDLRANPGIGNRMILIRFDHIPPSYDRPHVDPELVHKLIAESTGIMQWAVEGLARLLAQNGFTGDR